MQRRSIFISGGAGFIGSNAAVRYAKAGDSVVIFDDLSRGGSEHNLEWVRAQAPQVEFIKGDIRDAPVLTDIFQKRAFDIVLHLAAQVAVTASVADPVTDHAINVLGTLHMLEAVRKGENPTAAFIYSSTNKVYGGLEHLKVEEGKTQYRLSELPDGVHEGINLDFHSPYGCSKGAADQYVRDYARIYGMKTIVMRQSCIYGERQMGIEDQGWIAWIMSRAALGLPARIYGTGKQVRDLLYIGDLLDAYDAATTTDRASGQIYNMGGGTDSVMSVLELMHWLEDRYPSFTWGFYEWRPGDQKVYISDISKAKRELLWEPHIRIGAGLNSLMKWIEEHKHYFKA